MAKAIERSIISITPQVEQGMRVSPPRDLYIDRLRSVMTAMVLLHHTAITYGAPGGWFWTNCIPPVRRPASCSRCSFPQTRPTSWASSSCWQAISRRLTGAQRLCALHRRPLPAARLAPARLHPDPRASDRRHCNAGDGKGFWVALPYLWIHQRIINGPLWFAQALLIFSLGYCAWRAVAGRSLIRFGS